MAYQRYEQFQDVEDTHKSCRDAFLRFIALDYALLKSISSMAKLNMTLHDHHIGIKIGKSPYSIDVINMGELKLALERSDYTRISYTALFSTDPATCDPEYARLEKFLEHNFDVDKQFLENCTPKPNTRTSKPKEMKKFSLVQEDHPMSITIEYVIEESGDGNMKLTIKNGTTTQLHNLHSERVAGISDEQIYFSSSVQEMNRYNIASDYAKYRTDLFLQSMLSFRIRFPNSHEELFSTHESRDDHFDYVTNEIEKITGIMPSLDVVVLLLKIFEVISQPLASELEPRIVNEIMPAKTDTDLSSQTVDSQPSIEDLLQNAGLTCLREELVKLVRSAPAATIETFGNILSVCKTLFDDNRRLSIELKFLDSQLPTLTSRFLASEATTSQQEFAIVAKDMVQDFSRVSITNDRLSALRKLVEADSLTNKTLHFFRSLHDIPGAKRLSSGKMNLDLVWAGSSWYDLLPAHRLDFLYVLYWMLSSDPRMYILYEYIHKRMKKSIDPDERPEAIFQGRLMQYENGGDASVSSKYTALMNEIGELDKQLSWNKSSPTPPRGLDSLLCEYRGRAI